MHDSSLAVVSTLLIRVPHRFRIREVSGAQLPESGAAHDGNSSDVAVAAEK